jgi:hypothetical protein
LAEVLHNSSSNSSTPRGQAPPPAGAAGSGTMQPMGVAPLNLMGGAAEHASWHPDAMNPSSPTLAHNHAAHYNSSTAAASPAHHRHHHHHHHHHQQPPHQHQQPPPPQHQHQHQHHISR